MDLEIVNPNAAGVDVGSRSHFVAKGQQTDDVKEFGVCASDHEELISWLKKYGIKTIAMESTGSYWQNLFSALQGAGFEVLLANGKFLAQGHALRVASFSEVENDPKPCARIFTSIYFLHKFFIHQAVPDA